MRGAVGPHRDAQAFGHQRVKAASSGRHKKAMQATEHFVRTAEQAAVARSFVRDTLAGWGVESRLDDVVLMTSELFTNAVLHGDGGVDVVLVLSDDHLRVEVVDDGQATLRPHAQQPAADVVSGRGLAIVDALSDTWGNGRDDRGRTRVWVEVPFG
jgi:anti-sigma regulatory factor (Ser/Thr protein kinase)